MSAKQLAKRGRCTCKRLKTARKSHTSWPLIGRIIFLTREKNIFRDSDWIYRFFHVWKTLARTHLRMKCASWFFSEYISVCISESKCFYPPFISPRAIWLLFLIWRILKRLSNMLCKKREQCISYSHKRRLLQCVHRWQPDIFKVHTSRWGVIPVLIRDKNNIYEFRKSAELKYTFGRS